MYEEGHSLNAIAQSIQAPKSSIRGILLQGGVVLRAHSKRQLAEIQRPKKMSRKTAPYGFCLINGQLVEDPKEMAIIQVIKDLWRSGMSQMAICRELNNRGLKPRIAGKWSQPTVRLIIERYKNIEK